MSDKSHKISCQSQSIFHNYILFFSLRQNCWLQFNTKLKVIPNVKWDVNQQEKVAVENHFLAALNAVSRQTVPPKMSAFVY